MIAQPAEPVLEPDLAPVKAICSRFPALERLHEGIPVAFVSSMPCIMPRDRPPDREREPNRQAL